MRIKNKKGYYIKPRIGSSDGEGGKVISYGPPVGIEANIYPASGKVQADVYGERLAYILNMLYDCPVIKTFVDGVLHYKSPDNKIDICEGYGVCVYVASDSNPDYKIISIKPYGHLFIELEKLL